MRNATGRTVVLFSVVALGSSFLTGYVGRAHAQTLVTFSTEDGLALSGTLHLPKASRPPVAGILLLAEPGGSLRSTYDTSDFAGDLTKNHGMAVLTVDFRGTGKNLQGRPFKTFSSQDLDNLQLDIRGAIQFLSAQKGVDPRRIGVVAAGIGANYALLEAARSPSVQALVLVSGSLSERAREFIRSRGDIPILCLAGKDDKEGFREMAEAFYLSKNKNSDIVFAVDHGTSIFSHTEELAPRVNRWLADNVQRLGFETEVSFNTDDRWSLHGRLRMPDVPERTKVPGVVFVHGGQHDQDTYEDLTRAVVKKGIATLTYNSRRRDRHNEQGVDLPAGEERDNIFLDVKAAINYLAAQAPVDANRIGIVAATAGTYYAIQGATGDPRVKTMVLLTNYTVDDWVKRYFTTADIPVFFIASSEDENPGKGNMAQLTREAYQLSKNKYSEFLLYDDAGRGSEMLKKKEELDAMIVRWMAEKLAPGNSR